MLRSRPVIVHDSSFRAISVQIGAEFFYIKRNLSGIFQSIFLLQSVIHRKQPGVPFPELRPQPPEQLDRGSISNLVSTPNLRIRIYIQIEFA